MRVGDRFYLELSLKDGILPPRMRDVAGVFEHFVAKERTLLNWLTTVPIAEMCNFTLSILGE